MTGIKKIVNLQSRGGSDKSSFFLGGTQSKYLRFLLEYIYSGESKVNQEELEDFMKLANSLKVSGLMGANWESNKNVKAESPAIEDS